MKNNYLIKPEKLSIAYSLKATPTDLKRWKAYAKANGVPYSLFVRHVQDAFIEENPVKKSNMVQKKVRK